MIEIAESRFGYWPNEQHSWFHCWDQVYGDEFEILQQLYAQMLGWA